MRWIALALPLVVAALASAQTVPPPADQGPIVGLYTSTEVEGDAAVEIELSTYPAEFTLYAVLSHPGPEVIGAAELRVEIMPESAPVDMAPWNGNPAWEYWGWPDLLVYWDEPQPVVDGHAWLFDLRIRINAELGETTLRLVPASVPTVPGEMAFTGPDSDDVLVMRPNSEGLSHGHPVFWFNRGVVATQARSLTAIKALFGGARPTLP